MGKTFFIGWINHVTVDCWEPMRVQYRMTYICILFQPPCCPPLDWREVFTWKYIKKTTIWIQREYFQPKYFLSKKMYLRNNQKILYIEIISIKNSTPIVVAKTFLFTFSITFPSTGIFLRNRPPPNFLENLAYLTGLCLLLCLWYIPFYINVWSS